MSSRVAIPPEVVAEVLTVSRRRCCVCFALRKDESEKRGQIAHLDRDPTNNAPENLAFLCLEHHDQYDSRTSQSKGLTIGEVKRYRTELLVFLSRSTSSTGLADTEPRTGNAFDLSVPLLETPSRDPHAVFKDFVLPLHQSVQRLHTSYLSVFHDILRQLDETGITPQLHRWVERECDRKVAERAELIGEYAAVRTFAAKGLASGMPELEAYLETVRNYLVANGLHERLAYGSRLMKETAHITSEQIRRAAATFKTTGLPFSSPEFLEWLQVYAVTESEVASAFELDGDNVDLPHDSDATAAIDVLIMSGALRIENPALNRIRISLNQEAVAPRVAALIHTLRDDLQSAYTPVNLAFGRVKGRLLS